VVFPARVMLPTGVSDLGRGGEGREIKQGRAISETPNPEVPAKLQVPNPSCRS
jgi:hypothetical protein